VHRKVCKNIQGFGEMSWTPNINVKDKKKKSRKMDRSVEERQLSARCLKIRFPTHSRSSQSPLGRLIG